MVLKDHALLPGKLRCTMPGQNTRKHRDRHSAIINRKAGHPVRLIGYEEAKRLAIRRPDCDFAIARASPGANAMTPLPQALAPTKQIGSRTHLV